MSQWGAFGKARRGLSADAILASYYGGTRPQSAPAGTPGTLRVGLGAVGDPVVRAVPTGAAAASGAFRVVADGGVLATVATGGWKVTGGPRAGTVRVVPPAGQGGAVALDQVTAGRTGPEPTSPVGVAFRLGQPALVAVAGAPAQPLAAGDHRVEVPAGAEAQTVTVTADAGGGRTATASAEVAGTAPAPVGPAPELPVEPGVQATENAAAFGPLPPPLALSQAQVAQPAAAFRPWLALPALLLVGAVTWAFRRGRRPHSGG